MTSSVSVVNRLVSYNGKGKVKATVCHRCKVKMKRVYEKIDGKFAGIGNRCHSCNTIFVDEKQ